jgi:hypothetical protein
MHNPSNRHRFLASGLVVALSMACDGDLFSPSVENVAGSYSATSFTTTTGGVTTDQLAGGASFTITLATNGTTSGRLFVPGGDEGGGDLDADLAGTWTLTGTTVEFAQTADTFVRDMPFTASRNRLQGEATFSGTVVRVTLTK